jgi:signal transduction histidine kinase
MLSHLLVSLTSIALLSFYSGEVLFRTVRNEVEHHFEDLLFAAANDIEGPLIEYLEGQAGEADVHAAINHVFANQPDAHYTVFLPDGTAVIDSSGRLPANVSQETAPEVWLALNGSLGEGEDFRADENEHERFYLAVRVNHMNIVYGVLRLDVPIEVALNPARQSLGFLVSIALLVSLGVTVLGFGLARSLARPLEEMTRTADSLARGELKARVPPPSAPRELELLVEAFNEMAGQLESHVDELRSFVANASHELRTPLTSIKLRVEALRNGALEDPDVSARFLGEVESEVDRLSIMVNDLLDLSRIEAGLESSSRSPLDIASLATDALEAFRPRAERGDVLLESVIDANLPQVMGNEEQLRRMIYNLVDNAIKYSRRGGVVVLGLQMIKAEGTLRLSVRDTGFGIAPAHLTHIFERFYRVEATRPRYGPSQGSGLGLPIARSIAEAHGGRIGVMSQVGKGSTFWVDLPILEK